MEKNSTFEDLMILGKNLDFYFRYNNMNIQEFSFFINYNRNSLSRLLAGEENIQYHTLLKIAKNLNFSLETLFSRNFINYLKENKRDYEKLPIYNENINYLEIFSKNVYSSLKNNNVTQFNIGIDPATTNRILKMKNSNPCIKSLCSIAYDVGKNLYELFS